MFSTESGDSVLDPMLQFVDRIAFLLGSESSSTPPAGSVSVLDVRRYRPLMLPRAVILGVACYVAGWVLVFISGHGGNSTGGSEIAWMIGGIMVYASMVILPLTALTALAYLMWSGFERLRRRG